MVRCILGTALRAAVWGSGLNLWLTLAGKTRGFWATKVVAVSVRTSKKLFTSRFNLRETAREAKAAHKEVGNLPSPSQIASKLLNNTPLLKRLSGEFSFKYWPRHPMSRRCW